jgi:prepilin-type N-terminal cleavage/methylation domain-containing protein
MNCCTRNLRSQSGFSMLEILVVVAIFGVLAAITAVQIGAVRPGLQGDAAMRVVMAQLNSARETAVAQRRLVEVSFYNGNSVRVTRHNFPAGTTTVLNDLPFEGGASYGLILGVGDTPDGFGNAQPISFGAAASIRFNTEGMLVDSGGIPVNGTVFVRIPEQPLSFRAVTVLGATGRVRGFRWNGATWQRV